MSNAPHVKVTPGQDGGLGGTIRCGCNGCITARAGLAAEDRLRAEVEKLRAEVERLSAENERLRGTLAAADEIIRDCHDNIRVNALLERFAGGIHQRIRTFLNPPHPEEETKP